MRKILKVVMLTLSLTSCTEVTEGLRDISQGTFVKKRVGNPFRTEQTTDSSLYNSLVNLSQGKAVGSSIKMETSDLMLFKALNHNTLIQENEVNYDYDQVELLSNELKRHKIFVKESKAGEKCSSPLSNNQGYTSSTYEFMINGKKLFEIFKWAIFYVWRLANLECLVLHKEIRNGSTLFTFKQIQKHQFKRYFTPYRRRCFLPFKNSPLGKP